MLPCWLREAKQESLGVREPALRVSCVLIWFFTLVAIVANSIFVWPQAVRLLRKRDVGGVSPATWAISTTLFSVWAVYAARTGYWALFATNLSCLLGAFVIMATGCRLAWSRWWLVACVVGVVSAFLVGEVSVTVLGAVMLGVGLLMRVPQAISLVSATDFSGFARWTWGVSIVTALSWGVVSAHRGAWLVVASNLSTGLASAGLLSLLAFKQRRATVGLVGCET